MNRLKFVFALIALTLGGTVWSGVATSGDASGTEAVGSAPAGLVTSNASPSVKAPSTRSIDTASTDTRPVDASRGPISPVGSMGSQSKNDGSHMKCWQHGRLIVDKRVKLLPAEVGAANRVRDAETGAEILTFDLKNATCVVQ